MAYNLQRKAEFPLQLQSIEASRNQLHTMHKLKPFLGTLSREFLDSAINFEKWVAHQMFLGLLLISPLTGYADWGRWNLLLHDT